MITSMTGFSSRFFSFGEETYKLELKSLNHRFLDLKVRIPRDLAALEAPIKAALEAGIKRGSVDFWMERQSGPKLESLYRINEEQAKAAYAALEGIRSTLGLQEPVTLRDVTSFPDVVSRSGAEERNPGELAALQERLLGELAGLIQDLASMRKTEGTRLAAALGTILREFRGAHGRLLGLREEIRNRARDKVRRRIEQCFEAYPTTDERLRALLETRIAQEIGTTLDRLDVEEELTRFQGHLDAIEGLLGSGGAVGKKLDFLFQELNREINTLGNKSQDLGVSREVIEMKTWIEQMREQSLNLE